MTKIEKCLHKIADDFKKWKHVNLSDIAAIEEGVFRRRFPLAFSLGIPGALISMPIAKKYVEREHKKFEDRTGDDYDIPEVSAKGIYQGQAYKLPLKDLEGMKRLYKRIMKKEWEPKAPKWLEWFTGDQQNRIAGHLRGELVRNPEARKKLKAGEIASIVYPLAYNVAKDKVKVFSKVPFKNGLFKYRGLRKSDFEEK